MSEKKTYQIAVVCGNCDYTQEEEFEGEIRTAFFHIPIGTTVEHFLLFKDCMNCACRGFLRRR